MLARVLTRIMPVSHARKFAKSGVIVSSCGLEPARPSQLLVDVSVIIADDARTGIQRVVRSLLLQLQAAPPLGYRVRPVFCTRDRDYCYANGFLSDESLADCSRNDRVCVQAGDVFLGLDLAAHLLPRRHLQLVDWKQRGVKISIVVYDLLPFHHPEWFNRKTVSNFRRWLRSFSMLADQAICISESVRAELTELLFRKYALDATEISVQSIVLGGNIEASLPTKGLPAGINEVLERLGTLPCVLVVGTLEPRKGHAQALAAIELLWKQELEIALVIVGKPGWKTEGLQARLKRHPEAGTRLFWFSNASDELLDRLYAVSRLVLVASQGEGFGLPLVEALIRGKQVLARDLPVFKELSSPRLAFFSGDLPTDLSDHIRTCLENPSIATSSPDEVSYTWRHSADQLVLALGLQSTGKEGTIASQTNDIKQSLKVCE